MFILVKKTTGVIIGSAINSMNETDCNTRGFTVFEIPDSEFYPDMMGMKLIKFESDG